MSDHSASDHSAQGRRVIFEGRVQGVGFRYTAASIARQCNVKGYVRNLRDGSVELVAFGSSENVRRLLDGLGEAFGGCIERQTAEEIQAAEPFAGFEIRP
jgi:acylphosphatase